MDVGAFRTGLAQSSLPQVPSQVIRNLEAGKQQTLVAFGTSLTAGGAWVGLLDAYLKARYPGLAMVFNEGASGHSSKYGLTLMKNVTRHAPDAVFIEFSMNDAYYPAQNGFTEGVPADSSLINLARIIDSIKAVNPACEIIPQTMDLPLGIHLQRRPKIAAYYAGYRAFSRTAKLTLADHEPNWRAIAGFDTGFYLSWLPDSIHPNAEASAAITFPGVLSVLTGARIQVTSPLPSAVYPPGSDIVIAAAVTTPVTRVDFYQGKTRIGTDSTAPYGFTWKGAAAGKYLVMARLVQQETAVAVSLGVPITIKAVTGITGAKKFRKGSGRCEGGRLPASPDFWLGRKTAPGR